MTYHYFKTALRRKISYQFFSLLATNKKKENQSFPLLFAYFEPSTRWFKKNSSNFHINVLHYLKQHVYSGILKTLYKINGRSTGNEFEKLFSAGVPCGLPLTWFFNFYLKTIVTLPSSCLCYVGMKTFNFFLTSPIYSFNNLLKSFLTHNKLCNKNAHWLCILFLIECKMMPNEIGNFHSFWKHYSFLQ